MQFSGIANSADSALRSRRRPRLARAAGLETLEQRRLLATHIINGTSADNTWTITASPGQVVVNGVTTNNASITDVQVNGLAGSDTLVINSASIPVVFNGGADGDLLNITTGHMLSISAAVTFNGEAGGDTLRIDGLPGTGNGSTPITYNGGVGEFDFLQIFNTSATGSWTYTRTSTSLRAEKSGYFAQITTGDIEYSYVTGGTLVDQFVIESAPSNSTTELDGAGGNDVYTIGNAQSVAGILGGVHVTGGAGEIDTVTIDDRSAAVSKTVHIDAGNIGAGAGDNLFGAGGYVFTASIAGPMTLKLGSASDNVYAAPDPMMPMFIEGNGSSGAGDLLGIAAVDTANPQAFPSGAASGHYTFGDRADITYSSVEQVDLDLVAPSVVDDEFTSLPAGHSLRFAFSEHVDFPPGDSLDLINLTTSQSIASTDYTRTWNEANKSATFTFPTLPNGRLPDGRYSARLYAGIPDRYGDRTTLDYVIEFFVADGTASADVFHFIRTKGAGGASDTLKLYQNADPASDAPTWVVELDNLSAVVVDGLGGDDELVVWPDVGGAVSAGTNLEFNGGAGADSVDVRGVANQPDTLGLDPAYVSLNSATIFHTGMESVDFDGDGGGDVVNIAGGPPLTFLDTQKLASLTIAPGARAALPAGADSMLIIDTLALDPAGTLDLADNDLVVNNGNYSSIFNAVIAGFGASTGIISSTSNGSQILALFDNALVGSSDWNGEAIGANAIVGKYTFFGDMNLDGQMTGDDYTVIDANLNTAPPAGLGWLSGDANLDGTVTGDDYTVIDANLGLGVGNPLSPPLPLEKRDSVWDL